MYVAICKIDERCQFNAGSRALKASALGQPRGMEWGGRWEAVQDGGTPTHVWLIHVDVWEKNITMLYSNWPLIKLKKLI